MPSMRPAWPMVRGRSACNFWRISWDRPGRAAKSSLFGQFKAFVAAIRSDVGCLSVHVDRVFGVDLELLADLAVERSELRPDARELRYPETGIRQQLERRAALAVVPKRQTMPVSLVRRQRQGIGQGAGCLQSR